MTLLTLFCANKRRDLGLSRSRELGVDRSVLHFPGKGGGTHRRYPVWLWDFELMGQSNICEWSPVQEKMERGEVNASFCGILCLGMVRVRTLKAKRIFAIYVCNICHLAYGFGGRVLCIHLQQWRECLLTVWWIEDIKEGVIYWDISSSHSGK